MKNLGGVMIDIVDIKSKVKNKELKFYLLDGNIYCKNTKTGESVIVGSYKEIEVNNKGMLIREKGRPKSIGYTPDNNYIEF